MRAGCLTKITQGGSGGVWAPTIGLGTRTDPTAVALSSPWLRGPHTPHPEGRSASLLCVIRVGGVRGVRGLLLWKQTLSTDGRGCFESHEYHRVLNDSITKYGKAALQ